MKIEGPSEVVYGLKPLFPGAKAWIETTKITCRGVGYRQRNFNSERNVGKVNHELDNDKERAELSLMTNGKFGSIWEPTDLKKIKVFDSHAEAHETARDRGCDLRLWSHWLKSIAKEWAKDKEKQDQYEKERERTAVWQEYPRGLVWKEKEMPVIGMSERFQYSNLKDG